MKEFNIIGGRVCEYQGNYLNLLQQGLIIHLKYFYVDSLIQKF